MNITIYCEDDKAHTHPNVLAVYPEGIGAELATIFKGDKVRVVDVYMDECGLTEEVLADTDVLFWWGHCHHEDVSDAVTRRVIDAVQAGMGFIGLHSTHMAKPFRALMGTSCTLRWRDNEFERVWISDPGHEIARGLPEYFELEVEEMYGEFFDIPTPESIVAIGWYGSGEVCKAVCTYRRGLGKVAYFQPGHETCPTYKNEHMRLMLANAARWAAPVNKMKFPLGCSHPGPVHKA